MNAATLDLIRAVERALAEASTIHAGPACDGPIIGYKLERPNHPGGVFDWLGKAVATVKAEEEVAVTVTPDTGPDEALNFAHSEMAKSLQQDINALGLKTKAQVEYFCSAKFEQQGKLVGHGGSHVWVSWPGRNGARILIVTSTNPNW